MDSKQNLAKSKKTDDNSEEATDFFNEFSENLDDKDSATLIPATAQNERNARVFFIRLRTSIIVFGTFVLTIPGGPLACFLLCFFFQFGFFSDMINLKRYPSKDRLTPLTVPILRMLYYVTIIFVTFHMHGDYLEPNLSGVLLWLFRYRRITFYLFYMIASVAFTLTLKLNVMRYQLRLFAMTHLAMLPGVVLLVFCPLVLYEGTIWFFAGGFIMTSNDNMAYVFGLLFGKRKLTFLSPKKTLEGYLGGILGAFGAGAIVQ